MGLFDIFVKTPDEASKASETYDYLKPGCVLRDVRGGYDHYGVYVGKKKVIHFTNGKIQKTSLKDFNEDSLGNIDVMAFGEEFTRDITLKQSCRRASSRLGMADYELLDNNCEHFALWCRTGEAISTQAFGSKSSKYSAATFAISTPRFISNIYSKQVGMEKSRKININMVIDDY
ncbi:Lecithin retinol acyltransferase [Marinomonas polaris DSM 16579]|uniref:Lecithin retinol acyltransferase n=1 Tax=Marinomonas polaris DSM 16579 TaxID=1122206 RepID=A0A1M5J260_9GAMM|nr:lecithin retinol acyltransferase family protein [Marinomonas polaris]SHG34687.1 Lecithin retinol acyltransferase [Marinomonas polaris DSM 16579]